MYKQLAQIKHSANEAETQLHLCSLCSSLFCSFAFYLYFKGRAFVVGDLTKPSDLQVIFYSEHAL